MPMAQVPLQLHMGNDEQPFNFDLSKLTRSFSCHPRSLGYHSSHE